MEQPVKRKRGKGCLITMLIILVAFIVLVIVLANVFEKDAPPRVTRSELAKAMDLTEEQETAVLTLFESCGIGELSSVELFQASEDRTSYYVNDKETAAYSGADKTIIVWVENESKSVQEIYFDDITIYADGEVKAQVPDYYISEEARNTYRTAAQMYVNQCLNYPDTAKYPGRSEWRFGVHDGLDVVQSTVTAQNAFGVTDTMQFTIKFNRSSGEVVSLVLDGKEYIE